MERYKKYKEAFPNKTDAQCIESLCWEVSDKVETIHKLLAEIERLRNPDVITSVCDLYNERDNCTAFRFRKEDACINCMYNMQTVYLKKK